MSEIYNNAAYPKQPVYKDSVNEAPVKNTKSLLRNAAADLKKLPWRVIIGVGVAGLGIALVTIGLLSHFNVIGHIGSLSGQTIQEIGFYGGSALAVVGTVIAAKAHYQHRKGLQDVYNMETGNPRFQTND